jgi:hypothetical protein
MTAHGLDVDAIEQPVQLLDAQLEDVVSAFGQTKRSASKRLHSSQNPLRCRKRCLTDVIASSG